MKGTSFTVKNGALEKLTAKLVGISGMVDKDIEKKMNLATNILYRTATARRPKISVQQHKEKGGAKGGYRSSDPNAKLGVPVKTGALQISIQKNVSKQGEKWVGRIWTDSPYAKYMEFGTSKIKPRSFMRSALNEQGETVKKIFQQQIGDIKKK